jgi:hypothetical protein
LPKRRVKHTPSIGLHCIDHTHTVHQSHPQEKPKPHRTSTSNTPLIPFQTAASIQSHSWHAFASHPAPPHHFPTTHPTTSPTKHPISGNQHSSHSTNTIPMLQRPLNNTQRACLVVLLTHPSSVTSALHDTIKNQSKSARMHDCTPNIHPHPCFTPATIPIHPGHAISHIQHTHCPHATNVPGEPQVDGNCLPKSNGATMTHPSKPPPTCPQVHLFLAMPRLRRAAEFAALRIGAPSPNL